MYIDPKSPEFATTVAKSSQIIGEIGHNISFENLQVDENQSSYYIAWRMSLVIDEIMNFVHPDAQGPLRQAMERKEIDCLTLRQRLNALDACDEDDKDWDNQGY